ncbi:CPBP family intramembrane glutamic endopeptidase [Treponema sp.]|uniref:CPBP family intramembrane glutamic endopeptidase n=1 Tax=Treponema sp. TaxID=166 RepID=UPI00388D51DC
MNKKIFSSFVFFYVLLFLVIPPFFAPFFAERQDSFIAHYPFTVFFNGCISFLIYIFALNGKLFENKISDSRQPFFIYKANALITFGILCLSSVILEFTAFFFKINSGIHNIVYPDSFIFYINFISGVVFSAFTEEIIYRFYMPLVLFELLSRKIANKRYHLILSESCALLLFTFGHIYLGVFGVLNAFICGAALRLCMIKTKSIWTSFIVHTLYNFLSFLLFWGLKNSFN